METFLTDCLIQKRKIAHEKGWWWMAILIVGSSLLAIIYVWKIVEILYFKEAPEGNTAKEVPYSMLIPNNLI